MLEAPAAAEGADVRLEGEERRFAQSRVIARFDEATRLIAGRDAVADVAKEVEILEAGRLEEL